MLELKLESTEFHKAMDFIENKRFLNAVFVIVFNDVFWFIWDLWYVWLLFFCSNEWNIQ